MTMRNLAFGAQARQALLDGVSLAARVAAPTLGPITRTVLVDRGSLAPELPGSGYDVTRALEDADPLRDVGLRLAREAAHRTLQEAGDGSATTLVLCEALLRAGLRRVAAGLPPRALKQGIDRAAAAAQEALKQQAQPVADPAVLARVATLACGDAALGQRVAEAFERLGADTVVSIETVEGHPPELEIRDGLWFDRGLASSRFRTGGEAGHVTLENAHLVLHDGPIEDVRVMLRILDGFAQSGKAIAFVAESFGEQALAALIRNQDSASLKVAAVLAPGFGAGRAALLEDIAVATGAQLIGPQLGTSLEHLRPAMLGRVERLEADAGSTRMIGPAGDAEAIELRRRFLRHEIGQQKYLSYDREQLEQRLARLGGGIARLRLGGGMESESRRLKAAAEQGVAATRAAMQGGVVPGGGLALFEARKAVRRLRFDDPNVAAGASIVETTLEAPLRRMLANAGLEPAPLIAGWDAEQDTDGTRGPRGIDLETGRAREPAAGDDIVEPLGVVAAALRNAVSTAGLLLLTEAGLAGKRSKSAS